MMIPTMETLEFRTLLSATVLGELPAGQSLVFDANGDGRNDAVLVNTGVSSPIKYKYTGDGGLAYVYLTANGGSFTTNTYVAQVGDTTTNTDDFALGDAKIGMNVTSGRTVYRAVSGDSRVQEGSVVRLEIGRGNLLDLTTTGSVGKVYLDQGNLTNVTAGAIDTISVEGDILGLVKAASINLVSANRLGALSDFEVSGSIGQLAVDAINGGLINVDSLGCLSAGSITSDPITGAAAIITTAGNLGQLQAGTISGAYVTVDGSLGKLVADKISGAALGTNISVGTHLGTFQAQTVTGGANGFLNLTFGAGVDSFTVGSIDGGSATGGGSSGTFVNINGDVARMNAGSISGGTADGAGSNAELDFSIYSGVGADGSFQPGNLNYLSAAIMSGGVGTGGGDVMLDFTIAHNLVYAKIGQMIGTGRTGGLLGGHHGGSHSGRGGSGGYDGGSSQHGCSDPSILLSAGHDIVEMVVGQISAGTAKEAGSEASVNISAANDIKSLTAGQIDAGTAQGDGSTVGVNIFAGLDILAITAQTFSGGSATGNDATAGLLVGAGRDIAFLGANLITGTQARTAICDPTVQFEAGGDIGLVMVGRITGGTVTSNGQNAGTASVELTATDTWKLSNPDDTIALDVHGIAILDANGNTIAAHVGNIGQIVTGTIDGGDATGAGALSYVTIHAAHDIGKLYADTISGGEASRGGFSYVSILAEHDIVDLQANLITGATDTSRCGETAVVIQAYNDIKKLVAGQIIAGLNGNVSILAGQLDTTSGTLTGGTIGSMVVGLISGNGGIVNIAAGGDIECLKVCKIVATSGDVDIVAGRDITASVGSIQTWSLHGQNGVDFSAVRVVNDQRDSIKAQYTHEGPSEGNIEIQDIPSLPTGTAN